MRWVIKAGSSTISTPEGGLDRAALDRLVGQLADLRAKGKEVILVTSGAIASGVGRLNLHGRPEDLRLKQSAAAVGQMVLMDAYEQALEKFSITPAQILLTREDLIDRQRYLNIRNTLLTLLSLGILPIINENDSVSTEEIQFGDNDTLSAIVATKVGADHLVLLSDVPGLYELDGEGKITKKIMRDVKKIPAALEKMASREAGSKLSVGGIAAKLQAAKAATASGIETWIASGFEGNILSRIEQGDSSAGTRFLARQGKLESRLAWIAFGRKPKGFVSVDGGAAKALTEEKKSLLPSGVKKISGTFQMGDTIGVKNMDGEEVARGLVNFSSEDLTRIKGHHTSEITAILGGPSAGEVIHCDNLVIL